MPLLQSSQGLPKNRINIFAGGKIQSFRASQLQVSAASDIFSRIMDAPSETIAQIEALLQSPEKKSGNWDTDRLLSDYFAQPVRFITYTGIKDLSQIQTKRYTLKGMDAKGAEVKIAKLHVLFAFPKEKMPDLKPHVKIRASLKAQNLQPLEDQTERFHVDDKLLQQAQKDKSNVTLVIADGTCLERLAPAF